MKRLSLVALLLLAGCSASQVQTNQKALITACNVYGVSLSTLADYKSLGKLSASTIDIVDQVDSVTGPLCDPSQPLPSDTATAINLVSASAIQLASIIQGAK